MARKKFFGEVASQPVVISMYSDTVAVMLSVKTDEGYKKFITTAISSAPSLIFAMVDTMFANVALSSIGDQVELEVKDCDSPVFGAHLLSFVNYTKGFKMP